MLHNPVLAYENGDDFMQAWYDAEDGQLDPFLLVVEGAIGDERLSGEGHWTGFGVDPIDGQPITVNEWIDRLAPKAAAVVAVGTCATYGGVPAMRNNPTGAMGLPDYLGWGWRSRLGAADRLHPRLPGAARQHDLDPARARRCSSAASARRPSSTSSLRPTRLFERTTREGCSRAGFTEQGLFATTYGNDSRCLVKLGCKGPIAECNVPQRGWVNGVGGCPNVGGICIGCTMPGFPDKFMPFMEPDPWGNAAANFQRFTYGPLFRHFRKRNLVLKFEQEPELARARGRSAERAYAQAPVRDGHARRDPALDPVPVPQRSTTASCAGSCAATGCCGARSASSARCWRPRPTRW